MRGFAANMVKYLIFFCNFVFVILSLCCVIFGAMAVHKSKNVDGIVDETPTGAAWTVIIFSLIIFFICFLGCCGAIKENPCMLASFGTIVFLILIAEFFIAISLYSYRGAIKDRVKDEIMEGIADNKKKAPTKLADIVNNMQYTLQCCGGRGPNDYNITGSAVDLPDSCCGQNTKDYTCNFSKAFKIGCFKASEDYLKPLSSKLAGFVLALGLAQLAGAFFACCLGYKIRQNYDSV